MLFNSTAPRHCKRSEEQLLEHDQSESDVASQRIGAQYFRPHGRLAQTQESENEIRARLISSRSVPLKGGAQPGPTRLTLVDFNYLPKKTGVETDAPVCHFTGRHEQILPSLSLDRTSLLGVMMESRCLRGGAGRGGLIFPSPSRPAYAVHLPCVSFAA